MSLTGNSIGFESRSINPTNLPNDWICEKCRLPFRISLEDISHTYRNSSVECPHCRSVKTQPRNPKLWPKK